MFAQARQHALVVGANDGIQQGYVYIPSIQYAVADAENIGAALRTAGYEVTVLVGSQATQSNIQRHFDRFASDVGPGETFLFVCTGQLVVSDAGAFYWLLSETNPINLDASALPFSVVAANMSVIEAARKLLLTNLIIPEVVLQTVAALNMYSQGLGMGDLDPASEIASFAGAEVLANYAQYELPGSNGGNSVFGQAVVSALTNDFADKAPTDGALQVSELYTFLRTALGDGVELAVGPGTDSDWTVAQLPSYKPEPAIDSFEPATEVAVRPPSREVPRLGTIRVVANDDAASYTVTGPQTYSGSGSSWSQREASSGDYTVTYNKVSGKSTPVSETKKLETGGEVVFFGVYVPEAARGVARVETEAPVIEHAKFHALLFATQDYLDTNVTDLEHPIEDARALQKVLTENYTFDVSSTEIVENPTRSEILGKLHEMRRLGKDDNLLVFFAGHGMKDDDADQGYWWPADARKNNRANWISNSDIRDHIRSIGARHTLLISDACFAGSVLIRGEAAEEERAAGLIYGLPSRKAMTSGANETVPDKSVFMEYLVKRLEQNQERYLTAERLFSQIKTAVVNNGGTTPLHRAINAAGDEGGDFVFVRR